MTALSAMSLLPMGCISPSGCAAISRSPTPPLLAAARAACVQANPGATAREAEAVVTSAADAIFIILESVGLLGAAADRALAVHAGHGLEPGGSRAQVTCNEPRRLPACPWCFEDGDEVALPAETCS